jgi:sec-independent protein translocase protein TatA
MFGFGGVGPMEVLLILVVALLVFGPKKLPEIGKAVGEAIRSFKEQSEKLTKDLSMEGLAESPQVEAAAASPAAVSAPAPEAPQAAAPAPEPAPAARAQARPQARRAAAGRAPKPARKLPAGKRSAVRKPAAARGKKPKS